MRDLPRVRGEREREKNELEQAMAMRRETGRKRVHGRVDRILAGTAVCVCCACVRACACVRMGCVLYLLQLLTL